MYPFPYSQAPRLDVRINTPRPAIDPTLAAIVDSCQLDLNFMRGIASGGDIADAGSAFVCNADTVLSSAPQLKHTEHSIAGPGGNRITLSVFAPKDPGSPSLPALYHIHGGRLVAGDRFSGVSELLKMLGDIECVLISVEYRLAPETRAPGGAEDCYAGLVWVSENAAALGVDPARIAVWGVSGGAALAAASCLMARDRGLPAVPIRAQILVSPMLDDRCESVSDQQFEYGSPWVTPYQAPARAEDLSRLPPSYHDAAECEVFRDAAVLYAMNMWRCGSTCELHIWPGAFHLFDGIDNPLVPLIHAAIVAKQTWLRRMMMPAEMQN
ncbi:hypothetical protein BDW75DRAFT_233240 [Aspergillus navahoensis]